MKSHLRACSILLVASSLVSAQEAINLDAVDLTPKPARRAGEGIELGGLKFNLYFDAGLIWTKEIRSNSKADLRFVQQHTSMLARATTSDDIEVYADIIHPGEVFEATIPLRFFAPSIASWPVVGKGAIRGGRMIVPFGDFEEHPIYGGTVMNSMLMRDIIWSDYGMSLSLPMGWVKTEWYVVNGIRTIDSTAEFGSASTELNELKGFGSRVRIDPFPWLFATASVYYDFLPLDTATESPLYDTPQDRALLGGLDLGARTGPVSWRGGIAKGWIKARSLTSHTKMGWYAESKWKIGETWALRLRGGQIDPDSRSVDDNDQTNVNVAGIWTKGPVDLRLTYFRNFETHWPSSKDVPKNTNRVLLETFVSI